jgi:hypothetical protein
MDIALYEMRDSSGEYAGLTKDVAVSTIPFNPWVRDIKVIGIMKDESCQGYIESFQPIKIASRLRAKVDEFILQHSPENYSST